MTNVGETPFFLYENIVFIERKVFIFMFDSMSLLLDGSNLYSWSMYNAIF